MVSVNISSKKIEETLKDWRKQIISKGFDVTRKENTIFAQNMKLLTLYKSQCNDMKVLSIRNCVFVTKCDGRWTHIEIMLQHRVLKNILTNKVTPDEGLQKQKWRYTWSFYNKIDGQQIDYQDYIRIQEYWSQDQYESCNDYFTCDQTANISSIVQLFRRECDPCFTAENEPDLARQNYQLVGFVNFIGYKYNQIKDNTFAIHLKNNEAVAICDHELMKNLDLEPCQSITQYVINNTNFGDVVHIRAMQIDQFIPEVAKEDFDQAQRYIPRGKLFKFFMNGPGQLAVATGNKVHLTEQTELPEQVSIDQSSEQIKQMLSQYGHVVYSIYREESANFDFFAESFINENGTISTRIIESSEYDNLDGRGAVLLTPEGYIKITYTAI